MLEKLSRNLMKALTGIKMDLTIVAFHQNIFTKVSVVIVVIQPNYWNNLRGMVEQPPMLRMLP